MLTCGTVGLTPLTTRLRVALDCEEGWGLSLFSHLLPQVCCGTESLSVGRSRLDV